MENQDPKLLLRYCKGQCTEAEQKELVRAVEESEELREQLQLLRLSLVLSEDIKEMETIDTSAAYGRTQKQIRATRHKRISQQITRYAAFLTLPLLLSSLVLGYLYLKGDDVEVKYAEVTAAAGSIIRYELPDKSVVWLNAGSKLRYPTTFTGDKREVDLQGEAYFDVEADPKHPFYVNTREGLSVYVYGTQFNVNAYEDETFIETVLEHGHINVMAPDGQTEVKLEPGERLYYDKQGSKLTKSKVDVYEKVAWKEGKMIFRSTSLDAVLRKLSRHFNVDIQFNNRSGKEYKYRATFRDETLPQILDYLGKSALLKWKTEEPVQQSDATFTRKKIIVDLY